MIRGMKDSGVEWIGEIPEDWNIGKIKNSYDITLGKMLEATNAPNEDVNNYLCAANIKWNGVSTVPQKKMHFSAKEKAQYLLSDGDVLISEGGAAGTSCVYHNELSPCYIQNSVHRCTANRTNNTKYLYYWMHVVFHSGYINSICHKATIMHYTKEKVEQTPILVLSPTEQQQIVHFLDRKCTAIDTAIEKTKKSIEKLEEYKKAVITKAVTKGIDPNAKMKDSGVEWIGKIPEDWEIIPNKHLMKKVKNLCPVYNGEDILSLSMKGVYVRDPNDESGKRPTTYNGYQYVQEGDLLMCLFDIDVTPRCVGRVYNDGLTSPAYSRFVMNKTRAIVDYYYYYYLALDFDKTLLHLSKNMRSSLTESDFGSINAPVPSPTEQQQIVHFLDRKCTAIDTAIEKKKKAIEKWEEYKKSLIYYAVTGKIDCRNEVI